MKKRNIYKQIKVKKESPVWWCMLAIPELGRWAGRGRSGGHGKPGLHKTLSQEKKSGTKEHSKEQSANPRKKWHAGRGVRRTWGKERLFKDFISSMRWDDSELLILLPPPPHYTCPTWMHVFYKYLITLETSNPSDQYQSICGTLT